jgi:hypothetical protein
MKKEIQDTITTIYGKHNYKLFQEKCQEGLCIDQGFFDILQSAGTFLEMEGTMPRPGKEWYVNFKTVSISQFSITYRVNIKISKLIPIFIVEYDYSITNRGSSHIAGDLFDFSGTPYCKNQLHFYERIRDYLQDRGYTELSFEEASEQTCDPGWFHNTMDTQYPLSVGSLLTGCGYDWDEDQR